MTTARHELIKQHIDSFPVLPVTVTRLMTITSDPESSAQDVMDAILLDQSLCLTILKIANSVLFGRPKKIASVKMAVTTLGFNEVQGIAITKSIINSFSKLSKKNKPFIDKIWTHSFISGMAARVIAKDLCMAPDIAFTAGLIHDIGKLIMLETFSDDYLAEYWMTTFSSGKILEAELNMFSFTHDQVGGQLLRKWFFPENLITAVSNHHRPGQADNESALAHVIQLADILSFYCCNQELLGEDDIATAVHNSLPEMESEWQGLGLTVKNDTIAGWFHWLLENNEQADSLKDAYSA